LTYAAFRDSLLADPDFPALPKRFTKRQWRADIIEYAVREWSDPPLNYVDRMAFKEDWQRRIRLRCREGMNPLLLVVLMAALSSIVQFVVTKLLQWWIEDRSPRSAMLWQFRGELEKQVRLRDDDL
jgi:hypothetical protein